MDLADLPDGFNLVPMRETRGYHPVRNERRLWSSRRRCQWVRRNVGVYFADPMEVQAKLILREVWLDILGDVCDSDTWDLRAL